MDGAPTDLSPSESAVSGSDVREEGSDRPKKARRTFLTQNACTRCRRKKSKCDGRRPVCGRCEANGAECHYDVAEEGMTRMQSLQQQLEQRNEDNGQLMSLFGAFRSGSDQQAANLLARLRMGEDLQSLIGNVGSSRRASLRSVDASSEMQDVQPTRPMHNWPPGPLARESWTSWSDRCESDGTRPRQVDGASPSTPYGGSTLQNSDRGPPNTPYADLPLLDTSAQAGYWQGQMADGVEAADEETSPRDAFRRQDIPAYDGPFPREGQQNQVPAELRPSDQPFFTGSQQAARSPVEERFPVQQRPRAHPSPQRDKRPSYERGGSSGSGPRRR